MLALVLVLVKSKMDSQALKSFRQSLKLSQVEFARRIGRSLQMLRNYEKGLPIPDEIVRRVESLPGLNLDSGDSPRHTTSTGTIGPEDTGPRSGGNPNAEWHATLDEILTSGVQEAITAVVSNLVVFGKYVRARKPRQIKPVSERKKA